jgi:hypothetical protein
LPNKGAVSEVTSLVAVQAAAESAIPRMLSVLRRAKAESHYAQKTLVATVLEAYALNDAAPEFVERAQGRLFCHNGLSAALHVLAPRLRAKRAATFSVVSVPAGDKVVTKSTAAEVLVDVWLGFTIAIASEEASRLYHASIRVLFPDADPFSQPFTTFDDISSFSTIVQSAVLDFDCYPKGVLTHANELKGDEDWNYWLNEIAPSHLALAIEKATAADLDLIQAQLEFEREDNPGLMNPTNGACTIETPTTSLDTTADEEAATLSKLRELATCPNLDRIGTQLRCDQSLLTKQTGRGVSKSPPENTVEGFAEPGTEIQINDSEFAILKALMPESNPRDGKWISGQTGYKNSTLRKKTVPLQEKKLIQKKGQRGGYKITDLGREVFQRKEKRNIEGNIR